MDTWESLRAECLACRGCALAESRHNVVFGVGKEDSEILFVGEGPGENEDLQGEPFVGRSGHLLDEMLGQVGLSRKENIYIANIVKCRPPQNRDPLPGEQEACIDFLRRQTRLMRPKIIVCLGRIAATRIINPEYKITREHGQWTVRAGVHMTAIYHPAALLRDPGKKPDTIRDLENIRNKIREICDHTLKE